jgi:hypothetical protein
MTYVLIFLLTAVVCYHLYVVDRMRRRYHALQAELDQYIRALAFLQRYCRGLKQRYDAAKAASLSQ